MIVRGETWKGGRESRRDLERVEEGKRAMCEGKAVGMKGMGGCRYWERVGGHGMEIEGGEKRIN